LNVKKKKPQDMGCFLKAFRGEDDKKLSQWIKATQKGLPASIAGKFGLFVYN